MNDELLKIENLWVKYTTSESNVEAVNGINIELYKGENLGLVGETGAGKTTTALSILQLLPKKIGQITGGSIKFNDLDLTKLEEAEMRKIRGSKISMIFQDPMSSLNPVLTVSEQIKEVLELHNYDKKSIDERVDYILEMVGISSKRKRDYPHQFSGGMKQRIVIAMAIACEPELILADEPTTALDVTIQAQILNMMEELRTKINTSMILITHDLGVVSQTCDKVAIMYAGEIVEFGTAKQVYSLTKCHPYTTGLFNSIPDLNKKTNRLSPIGGLMPDPTNLPKGCKFNPRCPKCMDICKTIEPEIIDIDGHKIKCHLYS